MVTGKHLGFTISRFYNVSNAMRCAKMRCVALQRLASVRGLRHLVPAYWAIYGPKSRIYFRGRNREVIRAGFDSEEAWRQLEKARPEASGGGLTEPPDGALVGATAA